jgi:hypothetical protein
MPTTPALFDLDPRQHRHNPKVGIIHVQALGQTAALNGGAQHVLAGARVLVWHEAMTNRGR